MSMGQTYELSFNGVCVSRQRGAFHWTVSVGVAKSERGKKEGGVSGSVGVVSVLWVWLDRVRFHWMVILGVAYDVGGVRQRIASVGRVSGRGFVVARQVVSLGKDFGHGFHGNAVRQNKWAGPVGVA